MTMTAMGKNSVSGQMLLSFIERLERIGAEREQLGADIGVVMAEAKSAGFDTKAIRYCMKIRKMRPADRQESESIRDMYLHAIGMESEPPLFRAASQMSVDITVREQVIEAMKAFVPANGAITIEAGGKPVRLERDKAGNVRVTDVVAPKLEPATPGAPVKPPKAKPDLPDVDADGAEQLGRVAYRNDEPIIANPFPFGDARRPRWDKGWRAESGSDGMDD